VDGGAGNDIINGGSGYDLLAGGAGRDIFLFNAALAGSRDQISDFSVPFDTIRLENAIFTAVGAPGVLAAAAFRVGSAAADATDRIIYDNTTGNVFYDRDGTGAAAQVKFAELDAGLALTRADFVVV
jgi:Ca2+-binding RTX toxin-like protein